MNLKKKKSYGHKERDLEWCLEKEVKIGGGGGGREIELQEKLEVVNGFAGRHGNGCRFTGQRTYFDFSLALFHCSV